MSNQPKERRIAPYLRGVARETKARELAHRIVLGGQAPLETANELGITRNQLYKILEGPAYRRESEKLFALVGPQREAAVTEATRRVFAMLPKALAKTAELLDSENEETVRKTAASLLDRAGLRPPAQPEQPNLVLVLSEKQASVLAEIMQLCKTQPVVEAHRLPTPDEPQND